MGQQPVSSERRKSEFFQNCCKCFRPSHQTYPVPESVPEEGNFPIKKQEEQLIQCMQQQKIEQQQIQKDNNSIAELHFENLKIKNSQMEAKITKLQQQELEWESKYKKAQDEFYDVQKYVSGLLRKIQDLEFQIKVLEQKNNIMNEKLSHKEKELCILQHLLLTQQQIISKLGNLQRNREDDIMKLDQENELQNDKLVSPCSQSNQSLNYSLLKKEDIFTFQAPVQLCMMQEHLQSQKSVLCSQAIEESMNAIKKEEENLIDNQSTGYKLRSFQDQLIEYPKVVKQNSFQISKLSESHSRTFDDIDPMLTIVQQSICTRCQMIIQGSKFQTECQHDYHIECFKEMVEGQVMVEKVTQILCQCKKVLSSKLLIQIFGGSIQEALFENQLVQLKASLDRKKEISKCENCNFFYMNLTGERSICYQCHN